MAIDYTNDYLKVGTNGVTAFYSGGGTSMSWILTRSFNSSHPRLFETGEDEGWANGVIRDILAYWFSHFAATQGGFWRTDADTLVLDTWQHLAFSWDSDFQASVPLIYVDAQSVNITIRDVPLGTLGADTLEPALGSNALPNNISHNGKFDDTRLYTRILSQKEIQTIFHSRGKDGNVLGMQRRLCAETLPEGTAVTNSVDLSPGKNAYTVTNNPFFTVSELAAKY